VTLFHNLFIHKPEVPFYVPVLREDNKKMYHKITSFFHQHTSSLCITKPPRASDVSNTCIVHSTPTSSPIFHHYITAKKCQELSSEKHQHVHFNPHVTVRSHIHRHSYTDEEFEATFYTEAEYAGIKSECREIVLEILYVQKRAAIKNNNSGPPTLDTILEEEEESEEEESPSCPHWGLERMLDGDAAKKRRHQAIDFVMEEQDRQWHMGTEEPDKICAVYFEISNLCQTEAHRIGLQDQQDQEQFLMADDYNDISL
jgi:hypothetical protein